MKATFVLACSIAINAETTMKKMIVVLVIALIMAFCANAFAENYAMVTMVVNVDYAADVVEIIDSNGNLWKFEGCEDWENDDL